jgi:hypothetical protein
MDRSVIGTIRIATPGDAPGLANLHVASWRETYAGLVPDAMLSSLSVEERTALWDQVMRQPTQLESTTVYLIERDGEIIAERQDAREDSVLVEVAYGWAQLCPLLSVLQNAVATVHDQ